ncbi:MAG: hypothetical protein AAF433_17440 [Bacteroidota bacterium]
MTEEDLKQLSDEALKKKAQGLKTMVGIFIPLVLALLFFGVKDYMEGRAETSTTIITICTIGGLVALLPDLRKVQKEVRNRGLK